MVQLFLTKFRRKKIQAAFCPILAATISTYSSLRGCQITSKTVSSFFFLGKKFVSKKFELTGLVEHGLGILGKCVLVHQNVTGLIVKKWLENNWTWKNVLTTCFEQRPNHFWESCWNRKNSWSYDQKINQMSQLQNWLDFMIHYLTSLGCSKGTSLLLFNMGAPLLKILHYEFTNRALTQRTCQ